MCGVTSLDNLHTNSKYQYLGRPQKKVIYPPSGGRTPYPGWQAELVKAADIPESLIQETVYLCDFGLAIRAGTSVDQKLQSPAIFCAPERFHNIDPTPASNMWSFMCIFAELVLGSAPFFGVGAPTVMSSIVDRLGPLPEHWRGLYNAGQSDSSWYDQARAHIPLNTLLEFISQAQPNMDKAEHDLVYAALTRGFCYLPESRLSATHLLQDASFRALVAFYRY
jgi:serine/threonine protein kinase